MPFDTLSKLLGIAPKSPEEQAQLNMYKQDPSLALKASGQVQDDRIKMAMNPDMQGPRLSAFDTTPAEMAQAGNALSFATMGSMGGSPAAAMSNSEKGLAEGIKAAALKRAARMEANGVGGLEQVGQAVTKAAPTAEKSLLDSIKEAAAMRTNRMASQGTGGLEEAQNVGKLSQYFKR